jgi:hypothetical protein
MISISKLLLASCYTLALFGTAMAEEPEPFRRDELEGRNFEYEDMSFLHRFSYRFRPGWSDEWQNRPEGFRITSGSVTTDEMYVVSELRKHFDFGDRVFGELRYLRNEDFDSRYDRFLTGLGLKFLDNWAFGLYSDIVAEKENVDLQFELSWQEAAAQTLTSDDIVHEDKDRFRLAFIVVDRFFNQKTDEGHYNKRPYTVFAEYHYVPQPKSFMYAWFNWSPELKLALEQEASTYRYQQMAAGARVKVPVAEKTALYFSARHESGERELSTFSPQPDIAPQKFPVHDIDRSSNIFDVEFTHDLTPTMQLWGGARYMYLSETNSVASHEQSEGELLRREPIIFSGVLLQLSDSVVFWPGVYLDFLNNQDSITPADEDPDTDDDAKSSAVVGKVGLPIEYHLPKHKAKILIDPTLEFPRRIFGGLNVQVQFEF